MTTTPFCYRLPPEQAWALLEFIYQLEEVVWEAYEDKLLHLVGPDPPDPSETNLNFDPSSFS